MGLNLRIMTKNHARDSKAGFFDFKAVWPHGGHADSVGVKIP